MERQRQPRTSCVWWRASLWIFPPTGSISATSFCFCPVVWGPAVGYPPHRRRFCVIFSLLSPKCCTWCQSAAHDLLLTQIPVLPEPLPSATCTFHTAEFPLRGPMGWSLASRAGTFNPLGSQPSVIPYPAMLVAVSLPAAGSTLFLYEKPKSNWMSFLRLIFSQDRQSQDTHPWYLLR